MLGLHRCNMDKFGQLVETSEWQEVELREPHAFGSFNRIKIKLPDPLLFNCWRGSVTLCHDTLPTAKGYWSLDGREFIMRPVERGMRDKVLALIRTEDCGLGTAKAVYVCRYF